MRHATIELNILRKEYQLLLLEGMERGLKAEALQKENERLKHELSKVKLELKVLRGRQ